MVGYKKILWQFVVVVDVDDNKVAIISSKRNMSFRPYTGNSRDTHTCTHKIKLNV